MLLKRYANEQSQLQLRKRIDSQDQSTVNHDTQQQQQQPCPKGYASEDDHVSSELCQCHATRECAVMYPMDSLAIR